MSRTWIIFFLRVLHALSCLRKLTLQWCMQESQAAVVITVAKPSQNLPPNETDSNRSGQGWHSAKPGTQWLLQDGSSWCSVSTGCAALGFGFQRHTGGGIVMGSRLGVCRNRCLLWLWLSPQRHLWKAVSCSFLTECAVLPELELAAGSRYGAITVPEWGSNTMTH